MVTDPTEVEALLIARNKEHFWQAQGTPFTTKPITSLLDPAATHGLNDYTLQDIENLPSCSLEVKDMMKYLRDNTCPQTTVTFTEKEVQATYRLWNCDTTTSPSGRHLDHYHTLLPVNNTKDSIRLFWALHTELLTAIPKTDTIPNRWEKIATLMIRKQANSSRINELCVIHLLEADYNLLLKQAITRTLMPPLERSGWFSKYQYGSRRTCSASDATFFQAFFHDHLALTRRNAIAFNNDATACFNRLLPNLSNLILQCTGLPTNLAKIHAKVLTTAKYHIKTALGVSEDSYQHTEDSPVYGTGQGATHLPIIWATTSSILYNLHRTHSHGAFVHNGLTEDKFSVIGFVDDTNNFTTAQDIPMLFCKAQEDAQWWANLLHASGAQIHNFKSFYYIILTIFSNAGIPSSPTPLTRIISPLQTLQLTSPWSSHSYLPQDLVAFLELS